MAPTSGAADARSEPAAGEPPRIEVSTGQLVLLGGALLMLIVSAALGADAGASRSGLSTAALHAHAHSGSLGWMTLAVLAVAAAMLDQPIERPPGRARREAVLGVLTLAAVAAFVLADATDMSTAKAWTG